MVVCTNTPACVVFCTSVVRPGILRRSRPGRRPRRRRLASGSSVAAVNTSGSVVHLWKSLTSRPHCLHRTVANTHELFKPVVTCDTLMYNCYNPKMTTITYVYRFASIQQNVTMAMRSATTGNIQELRVFVRNCVLYIPHIQM